MSEKPRVYQGVRVKTTVKELLQRHRARETSSKKLQTIYLEQAELCASILKTCHEDPPPSGPPAGLASLASPFPEPGSSCSMQAYSGPQQQQFGDLMLPSSGYSFTPRGTLDYSPPLPPLPASSPQPWSNAPSSDVDYYGQGQMAAYSSLESLTFCSPHDHSSYSPQDSFSSSSSSCYDSPTRMDSSFHGFHSDSYPYQHCSPHQDSVPGCWPAQQESITVADYTPFYNPTDYPYIQPVEESYFRKDFPLGSEMRYNVL